jgi:hypothetical protein
VTYDVASPSLDRVQEVFAVMRYILGKASSRLCLSPCSESLPARCRIRKSIILQLIDLHKSFLPFRLR